MPRSRTALALLVALPPLAVAVGGLFHPVFLTPGTAEQWRLLHLVLVPLFPLVAVSLWVLLRGERGPAAWGARLLAAAYAVLYGSLDAIAGIGAPQQVIRTDERGDARPPVEDLFEIGDALGHLGVYALAAASALTALVLFLRSRSPLVLVGGAVAAVSCTWFYLHHVFPPRGVLSMVGIAVGFALMALGRRPVSDPAAR